MYGANSFASCGGRFPNPVTDICWSCMFPMEIGPVKIPAGVERGNFDPPLPFLCTCMTPLPRIGVAISFWEPANTAEVVREPFCSPTLGGRLATFPFLVNGTNNASIDGRKGDAFYHVHWIRYPLLNWLGIIPKSSCMALYDSFDVAYLSELDPLWQDDELSFILNPEAVLFANPIAQLACAADAVTSAAANFGLDPLFWCSGSQGSVFPLDGEIRDHNGGVDSSLLAAHRMIFKMHREGLAMDTSTLLSLAACNPIPQPVMRKTQYKQQMMYPIPNPFNANGFGKPSSLWINGGQAGKEFPYKGEDYSYLVWRKYSCCAL